MTTAYNSSIIVIVKGEIIMDKDQAIMEMLELAKQIDKETMERGSHNEDR